jgi:putative N6-adenine-specific DNA methylase
VPIHTFRARRDEELYKQAKDFPWEDYFSEEATFSIDAAVHSEHFSHSQFALLKVKDAIVDRFREQGKKRPNIERTNPDIKIHLHIRADKIDLSLDSSGDPLFKRGYKKEQHKAPINESLAAAMIMLSDWDGEQLLMDPMCGSATIAIEAALIQANVPPNLLRERFGFEFWSSFDGGLLAEVLEEGRQSSKAPATKIIVRDKDSYSIRAARVNINVSKMKSYIEIEQGDFFEMEPPAEKGVMIFNPPYGERLGDEDKMIDFYQEIGTKLKHSYAGWDAWLISSDIQALKRIGLRAEKKFPLMNGKLECSFRKFSLFEGKRVEQL